MPKLKPPCFLANLFKRHTIDDDIALARKIALEDVNQSHDTIMRAAYIKHMAEAKLRAHNEWYQQEARLQQALLIGVKHDRPTE